VFPHSRAFLILIPQNKEPFPMRPLSVNVNRAAERALIDTKTTARRRPRPSKKLFVPGEIPAEFFVLLKKAFDHFRPAFINNASDVAQAVRAEWMCLRHSRALDAFRTRLFRRKPDSINWTAAEIDQLEILQSNDRNAQRALGRALQLLENIPQAAPGKNEHLRTLHRLYRDLFDLEAFPYEHGSGFPFNPDE
jgi:hypothetical protein